MQIDMEQFCHSDASAGRYPGIQWPWVHEGIEYATDGRVMIWRKTEKPNATKGKVPDVSKVIAGSGFPADPDAAAWRPWPENPIAEGGVWFDMDWDVSLAFAGIRFAGKMWLLVRTLPDVQFLPPPAEQKAVALKWDGGYGLLMQVSLKALDQE